MVGMAGGGEEGKKNKQRGGVTVRGEKAKTSGPLILVESKRKWISFLKKLHLKHSRNR